MTTPPAIVVVNFGSHDLIEANFDPAWEVPHVLVDNFKSEDDRRAARELAARRGWQFVAAAGNLGFGGGVNVGVRAAHAAGHDTFILLNPDARVDVTTIDAIARRLADDPMALVAPRVLTPEGRIYFTGSAVRLASGRMMRAEDVRHPPPMTWPWISGACMAFGWPVFEAVGGYDDRYFLYWEDVDFSIRAARAGAQLDVLTDVHAVHDENGTQVQTVGRAKSDLYYRYCARNRLLFASQHLDTRRLLAWVARTPRESYLILMQGGRRQLLHSRSGLRAVARGSVEGLAIALGEVGRRLVARFRPRG